MYMNTSRLILTFLGVCIFYSFFLLLSQRYILLIYDTSQHIADDTIGQQNSLDEQKLDANEIVQKNIQTYPLSHEQSPIGSSHMLPKWIQDYKQWHRKMRQTFPGQAIITDPNAPPVLVRTCLGLCGGLHDRLGQLPLDLYIANQTQRILLIKWIKPQPLEEFLIPPEDGIDWTFPLGIDGWGTNCNTLNLCAKQVRARPSLNNNNADNRRDYDYEKELDANIALLNHGSFKDTKAVTFQLLGHLEEDTLEKKLKQLGEVDMIHSTQTFGNIYKMFFQPHPNIQKEIDQVNRQYGLVPNQYTMIHCRVRHPKAYPMGMTFDGAYISNADKIGLPFVGMFKDKAVETATRAIQCAATIIKEADEKLYFMADESNLVKYITRDLTNTSYVNSHPEWFADPSSTNSTAKQVVTAHSIVARDQNIKNAHIDKNKGRPPEEYYGTFVDLYLGINAKCVAFGIGNYALFATKISGTKCKIRYAKELWGLQETSHKETTEECKLP